MSTQQFFFHWFAVLWSKLVNSGVKNRPYDIVIVIRWNPQFTSNEEKNDGDIIAWVMRLELNLMSQQDFSSFIAVDGSHVRQLLICWSPTESTKIHCEYIFDSRPYFGRKNLKRPFGMPRFFYCHMFDFDMGWDIYIRRILAVQRVSLLEKLKYIL